MANVKFVSASRVYAKDAPPAVGALDLEIKDGEFMASHSSRFLSPTPS